MAEEFSETGGAAQQQQPPSRPWMRIIMQIVIFQLVMRFFGGNKTPKVKDPVTGEIVPPLQSALYAGEPFDAFMFLSPEPVESWTELTKVGELVMTVPYQTLKSDMWKKDIKTDYNYTMTAEMLESLTMPISEQQRLRRLKTAQQERQPDQTPDPSRTGDAEPAKEPVDEDKTQADQDDSLVTAGDGGGVSGGAARVNANPDDPNVSKFAAMYEELQKGVARSKLGPLDHASVYLTIAVVPHSSYRERSVAEDLYAESSVRDSDLWRISVYSTPVVRWVEPFTTQELQSLLETSSPFTPPSDFSDSASSSKKSAAEKEPQPHWVSRLDVRVIHDTSPLTPQGLANVMLRRHITIVPSKGAYLPVIFPSDFWALERQYVPLNDTLKDSPVQLHLTFNLMSQWLFTLQSQLQESWAPTPSPSPTTTSQAESALSALTFQTHTRKETFMFKRILLDTNPFFLAFSACFIMLHTAFSFLAFKNDVQFWRRNESMQGLSALSVLVSFVCEVVIGLYLFDSADTSWLIMFEIFMGIGAPRGEAGRDKPQQLWSYWPYRQWRRACVYVCMCACVYVCVCVCVCVCMCVRVHLSYFHDVWC
eukprot:GHVU01118186.1.p1 GENE.GHVU01118186.1~~GHVU01118186.1.p1  ORF type:complete len:593 (+),score=99.29 GHVU01118186.1:671-2449(+)